MVNWISQLVGLFQMICIDICVHGFVCVCVDDFPTVKLLVLLVLALHSGMFVVDCM